MSIQGNLPTLHRYYFGCLYGSCNSVASGCCYCFLLIWSFIKILVVVSLFSCLTFLVKLLPCRLLQMLNLVMNNLLVKANRNNHGLVSQWNQTSADSSIVILWSVTDFCVFYYLNTLRIIWQCLHKIVLLFWWTEYSLLLSFSCLSLSFDFTILGPISYGHCY